jgi:anti-anti-sigma regulatory factor
MLKIRRAEEKGCVIFTLSGRIEEEHVTELQHLLEADAKAPGITLDLEEVRLVDRKAVKFLAACEGRGIELKHCASYIRQWIETGGDSSHEL